MNKPLLMALTIMAPLVGLPLFIAGCGRSAAQSQARLPSVNSGIAVELLRPELVASQDKIRLSGTIEPWRQTTVGARVAEKLTTLPVEIGTPVRTGDLLAGLDDAAALAALADAEAGLLQVTAGRRQLEAELTRASIETAASVDAARAQIAQSEAGIRQAVAQAKQASEGERKARTATRNQELSQAESGLRRAQADETLAKTDLDRYTMLVQQGALPQQALDRAKAAYEGAKATREGSEQTLSLAREGARSEDIASASAGVTLADAAVSGGTAKRAEARSSLAAARSRDSRLTALRRQIDGLKAQEERAKASIQQARIHRDKHQTFAPFSGRVLAKLTEVGETVGIGSPIVRIGEIERVKAVFAVPEAVRSDLHTGQIVSVTADALPGRVFRGRVHTVGYQGDRRARTFVLEVEVPNPSELLLPSMAVRLTIFERSLTALFGIPVSAVASDGSGAFVFTVSDGKAIRRRVTLGSVVGDKVVIQTGISHRQEIVAAPQGLTDGATVHIVPDEVTEETL